MEALRSSLESRDPTLVEELRNEANSCEIVQPNVADRLREMSNALQRTHELVNRFVEVGDMGALLKWYQLSPTCFSPAFFPVVECFLNDAISANDAPRVVAFRHALELRAKLVRMVEALPKTELSEQIGQEPLLTDPAFHDFLETISRLLVGTNDDAAKGTRRIAEHLRYVTRLHSAYKHIKTQEPHNGRVRVRLPSRPEMAELWFLVDPEIADRLRTLAERVVSGQATIQESLKNATEFFSPVLIDESAAMVTVYSSAAFCEHLLCTERGEIVAQAIDLYKTIVDGKAAAEIEIESRATFVLRYANAIVRSWRQLPESEAVLSDTVSRITQALSNVTETQSPRLVRDLYFARARLLENLAVRDRDQYIAAERDYRAGLAVSAVAYESEARGRALGDLANTLTRAHNAHRAEYDGQVIELFEEALRLLPADERPVSRGVVQLYRLSFGSTGR
jgi:hypothetical protein